MNYACHPIYEPKYNFFVNMTFMTLYNFEKWMQIIDIRV
jgi:hypothetical protein